MTSSSNLLLHTLQKTVRALESPRPDPESKARLEDVTSNIAELRKVFHSRAEKLCQGFSLIPESSWDYPEEIDLQPLLKPLGADAVFVLASLLKHEDAMTRGFAALGLGHLGTAALPAVPQMLETLRQLWWQDIIPTNFTSLALKRVGEATMPALLESEKNPSPDARVEGLRLAEQFAPHQREATLLLLRGL
jgi:hypothetical protein